MNIYLCLSIVFFTISIATSKHGTKSTLASLLNSSAVFLYLALTILYFLANYFTGEGINEAVLFSAQYGMEGAGFGEFSVLISIGILLFLLAFALTYLFYRIINNSPHPRTTRIKGAIHSLFLLFAFLAHPLIVDLHSIYKARSTTQSTDFSQYYMKPDISGLAANNLNLVYIYAESLEKTYFDESIFPDLLPNLKKLKTQSTEFTDINQVAGAGWTIGGMVSSQCSIPLFLESGPNSMGGSDAFLSGAECLGDVLKNLDYYLVYVQGARTVFSGKNKFYSTHSFDEIYGREELKDKLKDKSYLNGWGLYDDSMLEIAFEKFGQLSDRGKKFGLFLLTLDTHINGQASKSCRDIPYGNGESSILNAVHCSDRLISKFITQIQHSKYAQKTLIVLTSDHIAMKNTATDLLTQGRRRDLFLILDPTRRRYFAIDKPGTMEDVAPTVLYYLGVDTDLGLGRNLLIKDSLFSSFGNFNKKLSSWRDDILGFWEFPKVSPSYEINLSEQKIQISKHSYNLPVLLKIDDSYGFTPLFERYSQRELFEYLGKFDLAQKFIWIDKCHKIDHVFGSQSNGLLCAAQGNLAGEVEIFDLDSCEPRISTEGLLKKPLIDKAKYQERTSKIEDL